VQKSAKKYKKTQPAECRLPPNIRLTRRRIHLGERQPPQARVRPKGSPPNFKTSQRKKGDYFRCRCFSLASMHINVMCIKALNISPFITLSSSMSLWLNHVYILTAAYRDNLQELTDRDNYPCQEIPATLRFNLFVLSLGGVVVFKDVSGGLHGSCNQPKGVGLLHNKRG